MIDKYLQQINDPNVVSVLTILNRDVAYLVGDIRNLSNDIKSLTSYLSAYDSRIYDLGMKLEGLERTCNTLNNKVFYGDDY